VGQTYTDNGIVIRSVDSGEADKYILIISENHGLGSFVARGARRLTSRKAPHLDLFNLVRFSVGRGDNPRYLNQVESSVYFPGLKKDFAKVGLSLVFAEILTNTLPLDVEDREIYLSFKAFLEGLELTQTSQETNRLGRRFGLFFMRHLGYPPPKSPKTDVLSGYFEAMMNRKIISKEIR
jgi:DNA repair protein RecO (recombination protein O)